jgi:hypothetical protein
MIIVSHLISGVMFGIEFPDDDDVAMILDLFVIRFMLLREGVDAE